jgi:hypothetical protein
LHNNNAAGKYTNTASGSGQHAMCKHMFVPFHFSMQKIQKMYKKMDFRPFSFSKKKMNKINLDPFLCMHCHVQALCVGFKKHWRGNMHSLFCQARQQNAKNPKSPYNEKNVKNAKKMVKSKKSVTFLTYKKIFS